MNSCSVCLWPSLVIHALAFDYMNYKSLSSYPRLPEVLSGSTGTIFLLCGIMFSKFFASLAMLGRITIVTLRKSEGHFISLENAKCLSQQTVHSPDSNQMDSFSFNCAAWGLPVPCSEDVLSRVRLRCENNLYAEPGLLPLPCLWIFWVFLTSSFYL